MYKLWGEENEGITEIITINIYTPLWQLEKKVPNKKYR